MTYKWITKSTRREVDRLTDDSSLYRWTSEDHEEVRTVGLRDGAMGSRRGAEWAMDSRREEVRTSPAAVKLTKSPSSCLP